MEEITKEIEKIIEQLFTRSATGARECNIERIKQTIEEDPFLACGWAAQMGSDRFPMLFTEFYRGYLYGQKSKEIKGKETVFEARGAGDPFAGIEPTYNKITVIVEGDPGGDPGEFEGEILKCLKWWFDGAKVEIINQKGEIEQ